MEEPSGGKRGSWRAKSLADPAAEAPRPAASPNAPPASSPGKGGPTTRRFLAGRKTTDPATVAVRFLLPATAFALIVVLLGYFLWSIMGAGPTNSIAWASWAVTSYSDRRINALNEFAEADAGRVRTALDLYNPGGDLDPKNTQIEQRIREFFDKDLSRVDGKRFDTVVLYVSGLCVGDRLVPQDAGSLDQGTPIARILEGLGKCPAPHKLLILDMGRLDADPDLGLFGNDFAEKLAAAYAEQAPGFNADGRSLWVLASNSAGERSWPIPARDGSIFGWAVVDELLSPGSSSRSRGLQSVGDFVRSVRDRVSKQTRGAQTPVILGPGDAARDAGFGLWRRDLSPEAVSEKLASLAPSAPIPFSPPPPPAKDKKEAKEDEKDATPPDPRGPVLAKLTATWQRQAALEKSPSALARPLVWNRYLRLLVIAERAYLAGDASGANQALAAAETHEGALQRPVIADSKVLAAVFGDDKAYQALLDGFKLPFDPKAIATRHDPSARWLVRLGGLPGFLDMEKKWTNEDLVRASLELRRMGDEPSIRFLAEPMLVKLAPLKSELTAADRARRSSEQSLMIGRTDELVIQEINASRKGYEGLRDQLTAADSQWAEARAMLSYAPYIVRWLGQASSEERNRPVKRDLDALLAAAESFLNEENPAKLAALDSAARNLRRSVLDLTKGADRDWRDARAALGLPFLPIATREAARKALLAGQPGFTSPTNPTTTRLDAASALIQLIGFVGADPATNQALEAQTKELFANSADRAARLDALGAAVRRAVEQARRWAFASEGETQWGADLRYRVAAALPEVGAQEDSLSLEGDAALSPAITAARTEATALAISRLDWDGAWTSVPQFDGKPTDPFYTREAAESLRAIGRQLSIPINPPPQAMEPATALALGDNQLPLALPGDKGQLIFDWHAQREQLELRRGTSADQVNSGRITLPSGELTVGAPVPIRVVATGAKPDLLPRVWAWFRYDDARVRWYPLRPASSAAPRKAAELEIAWQGKGDGSSLIDLIPNQSLPLAIRIKKNEDIKQFAVEFSVEDRSVRRPVLLGKTPTDPTAASLAEGAAKLDEELSREATATVTARLLDGERELDSVRLEARIERPAELLAGADVFFDKVSRVVTARVQPNQGRLRGRAIDVELAVAGDETAYAAVGGKPRDTLAGEAVELTYKLPERALDEKILRAHIAVAGVPRVFRFEIDVRSNQRRLVDDWSLAFASPKSGEKYFSRKAPIGIELHADGPSASAGKIEAGPDRAGRPYPDVLARRFLAGRQVAIRVEGTPNAPFALRATMTDPQGLVPVAGAVGPRRLLAWMTTPNERIVRDVEVLLIDAVPPLTVRSPDSAVRIVAGEPIRIVVDTEAELRPALEEIRAGVDLNGDGALDKMEIKARGKPGAPIDVPTAKIEPGAYRVLAVPVVLALDDKDERKEQIGEPVATPPIQIDSAMEKKAAPNAPGTLVIRVLRGDEGVRATVKIEGPTNKVVQTDDEGRASIEAAPGVYKISASTDSPPRQGQVEGVTVEPGKPTPEVPISVKLS